MQWSLAGPPLIPSPRLDRPRPFRSRVQKPHCLRISKMTTAKVLATFSEFFRP